MHNTGDGSMQVDKQKGRGKDATNFQGDVLRILDETGTAVAAYTYDPRCALCPI